MVIVILVVSLLLTKAAAALFFGLWHAERSRRIAAERMLVTGTPDKPQPRRLGVAKPSEELVEDVGKQFSDDTLKRGAELLVADARAEGIELNPEEAMEQARFMLNQVVPFNQEDDFDIPGAHATP